MSRRAKTQFSRPRRRVRGGKTASKWIAPVVAGVAASIVLGGVGFAIVSGANEVRPDVMGCYDSAQPQGSTMLWWDVSMGWSASQERDIRAAVVRAWQTLPFNDRFAVITTNKATVGDLASGEIEICGPARSDADYARHGIDKPASSGFLANEADKRFREIVDPVIDGIFAKTKATGAVLALDSPLLEQMQAISRGPGFRDAGGRKRLILFTDGIQNTEIARFCDVKGDLPSFARFKKKREYRRVAPAAMPGVEVSLYLVLRGEYPPYCTEDELADFWRAYFEAAGASRVDVYRLRPSGAD
jgi:hypothetical protein